VVSDELAPYSPLTTHNSPQHSCKKPQTHPFM
jgi:hypothetical protein